MTQIPPTQTIERPLHLYILEPFEAAAAVDHFIGAPQESGGWEIDAFNVSPAQSLADRVRSAAMGTGRFAQPGDYIRLYSHDKNVGTMMSNTRDELKDLETIFKHAKGNVLVSGLGLGCVVSGLLAMPQVDSIDVIELDANIIKMVGPAFEADDRVSIFHGNALTHQWSANDSWDYAWHDIWAKICSTNLAADTAYNGVGYDSLFKRYAERAPVQQAWAFNLAVVMEECERRAALANGGARKHIPAASFVPYVQPDQDWLMAEKMLEYGVSNTER